MSSAAHAAVIAQAIKASGAIVRVEPAEFMRLVQANDAPLVVGSYGGVLMKRYQYLTSYKGLDFHTKSREPLTLGPTTEVVRAVRIWMPR